VNRLWKWVAICVGYALVCALAVSIRMHRVHDQTGEWKLHPSATPVTLRIDGQLYDRAERRSRQLRGTVDQDATDLGGGELLFPPGGGAPAYFQVHYRDHFYDYRPAAVRSR